MRNGLDPQNPAFAWIGEKECADTVLFIDKRGGLAWVPYVAMESFFRRELPRHTFYDWHLRLIRKENKK